MAKKKTKTIKPKDYTVEITVKNGALGYSTADRVVKPGDRVRWICSKDFSIQFANNSSPFTPNRPSLSARGTKHTAYGKIKKAGGIVAHKYSVAVYVGGAHPILMDDPQIIIDDSGGAGGRLDSKGSTTIAPD